VNNLAYIYGDFIIIYLMMPKVRQTKIVDWTTFYKCSKCWEFKLKECFSANKRSPTKVRSACKECEIIDNRLYHSNHREQERLYNKVYRKNNKGICVEQLHRHPEKRKARIAVYNFIRYYKIKRPDICPICWSIWYIDAHHPDYTKRNIIVWCCRSCHSLIHRWDYIWNLKTIDLKLLKD
jgi:hypothetical protein